MCIYVCVCVCESENVSCAILSKSLQPYGLQPAGLLCPWNSPGKNTGVSKYSLLQGIFLTQGSNLGLLHCRQILYHLSHQEGPYMYVYVYAYMCVYVHVHVHI